MQVDLNEVQVEIIASKEQQMMQLHCSEYLNDAHHLYWKPMGLCYAIPPFSHLAKVLRKIALEGARVVLCTPDWGTTGEHAYWRRLLDRMTAERTELHNGPTYVPEDSQVTIPAPEWGSFLSIVEGSLNSVPLSELHQVVLKDLMVEKRGLTLLDLKKRSENSSVTTTSRLGPSRSPVAILLPTCRLPVAFLALLALCRSPVACLLLLCCSSVALLPLPCRFPVAFLPPSCRYPVASCRFLLFPVGLLIFAWHLPVALLSPFCCSFLWLSAVASLSLPCRRQPCCPPVVFLLLSCCLSCRYVLFPVASLSSPCHHPVAALSPSCHPPVAALLLPSCRLPVASCRFPAAFLPLFCRLPVAMLSSFCCHPVAFLLLPAAFHRRLPRVARI